MENFTHLNVSDIQNWNIGNSSKNSNAEQVTLDIVASSNYVGILIKAENNEDCNDFFT